MSSSPSNRLSLEKSPYLLQHANNPVDWYPWGKEAFEKAAREDKPIFLSIGYSTCHWCHVMEKESFENPETAALLNKHFVSIKVDREERPDLDGIYMGFVMAATGSGGWPMSVFLSPDQKPFFGGTYFPPSDRYGMPGFPTLLHSIQDAWKTRRDEILKSAEASAQFLSQDRTAAASFALTSNTLAEAVEDYTQSFDPVNGGFGGAPKFPRSHGLSFLLGESHYARNVKALEVARKTLDAMAGGGMMDQLGGGFHRYSTDALWRVPHFEKMLYDQALLVRTYVDAYRLTRNPEYARVVRQTLDYVLRDLTHPDGGFFSAEDADSQDPDRPGHSREGAFYVWTPAEIRNVLGAEREPVFSYFYGVEEKGNAVTDPHGEFTGRSVLYQAHTLNETAQKFGKTDQETAVLLEEGRRLLMNKRNTRPRPSLDDKVLTDWNGLMIGAFADAARALDEPRYLEAARRAAEFIESRLVVGGRLYHRWRLPAGQAADGTGWAIPAFLSDEVFLASGYLLLYESGFDEKWLRRARELADDMLARFWDEKEGGFFVTAGDGEPLLARQKEIYDGAVPSGNSTAAHLFYRLWSLLGRERDRFTADRILSVFSGTIVNAPAQYPQAMIALRMSVGPSREVVLAGDPQDPDLKALARETGFSFSPNQVTLFHRSGEGSGRLEKLAPFVSGMVPVKGKAAAYVCINHACKLPETEPERLRQIFQQEAPSA